MINQKMNQFEMTAVQGLVATGSDKLKTAYIEPENESISIGHFVMLSTNASSASKGLIVKKTDSATKESFGMVVNNSKTDTFGAIPKDSVLSIAPLNEGIEVYIEAKSAFSRGDELEIDTTSALHRVKKKSGTGKQVGIALENISSEGGIARVLLRSF